MARPRTPPQARSGRPAARTPSRTAPARGRTAAPGSSSSSTRNRRLIIAAGIVAFAVLAYFLFFRKSSATPAASPSGADTGPAPPADSGGGSSGGGGPGDPGQLPSTLGATPSFFDRTGPVLPFGAPIGTGTVAEPTAGTPPPPKSVTYQTAFGRAPATRDAAGNITVGGVVIPAAIQGSTITRAQSEAYRPDHPAIGAEVPANVGNVITPAPYFATHAAPDRDQAGKPPAPKKPPAKKPANAAQVARNSV